jgi:hypothetical protein
MKKELQLKNLIENMALSTAPIKTLRAGKHYEFVIGIGNDEVAFITMTKEAYDALIETKGD